jgi:hypothetical protein
LARIDSEIPPTSGRSERNAMRGGLYLPRRDIVLWVSAIFLLNQLSAAIFTGPSVSLEQLATDIGAIGIFQLMAWYAILRLLIGSDPITVARWRDLLVALVPCLLLFLPTAQIMWVAAAGIAIYWWVFNASDPKLRAAGVVLVALSVQAFWGHVFFHLVAFPLLCAETAVVGAVLEIARAGTIWQDNVITGPSGFGIVILDDCSAFHNLSLAMLCWITLSKLRHQNWYSYDFVIGILVGLTMIFLNVVRLCLMAWNIDLYHYWHDGIGAEIFAIGASLSVLLISLYGSRPGRTVA